MQAGILSGGGSATNVCNVRSETPYYDAEDPVEDRPIPSIVLLPKFDALLLGYRDKTRVLSETHRKRVFRAAAQVEAVVLINGRVAATWRLDSGNRDLEFTVEPFARPSRASRNHLEDTCGPLATFLKRDTYSVRWI